MWWYEPLHPGIPPGEPIVIDALWTGEEGEITVRFRADNRTVLAIGFGSNRTFLERICRRLGF